MAVKQVIFNFKQEKDYNDFYETFIELGNGDDDEDIDVVETDTQVIININDISHIKEDA